MSRLRIPALIVVCCLLMASGAARALTQDEVMDGAGKLYRTRIVALERAGMLDRDAAFLARVKRIAQHLIAQAVRDDPTVAAWPWEFHVSDASDDNASCMAGGRILLSQPYVEQLALTDAQLAMVLSHEMQHALLRHNLKEYELALRLDPAWVARPFSALEDAVDNDASLMARLAPLNMEQEIEADRAGMAMAWRAGWPAQELAGYFRKLDDASDVGNRGSATHPAPRQRWRAARRLAGELDSDTAAARQ